MSECPHCGQPVFDDVERVVRQLSKLEQAIFRRVARAGQHGVDRSQLYDHLYADDPDPPEPQTVTVLISRLNRKLRNVLPGKQISAGRGRGHGIYTLQDTAA